MAVAVKQRGVAHSGRQLGTGRHFFLVQYKRRKREGANRGGSQILIPTSEWGRPLFVEPAFGQKTKLTSRGSSLLLSTVMSTCMNSLPPTCWWNGVEHLSTSISSKPRHKNITFGWFEVSLWRTRIATTAHLERIRLVYLQFRVFVDFVFDSHAGRHVRLFQVNAGDLVYQFGHSLWIHFFDYNF